MSTRGDVRSSQNSGADSFMLHKTSWQFDIYVEGLDSDILVHYSFHKTLVAMEPVPNITETMKASWRADTASITTATATEQITLI